MSGLAVAHVVKGHGLRQAGVEPAGGLVDDPQVPLGWVSIADQKFQPAVALQASENYPQESGLAVLGKLVGEPEPGQGQAIIGSSAFHQGVGIQGADPQGQSAQESAAQEYPE